MMKKVTKNQFKLMEVIINLSDANNWDDAKREWTTIKITEAQDDDFGSCICGKYPIKEMIQLFNQGTKQEVIVGNCCIKKFFEINDYDKVFKAIRENRVNKFMIEDSYRKGIISNWEGEFMINIWRKRLLTEKQNNIYIRLSDRIINFYKGIIIKGGDKNG